MSRLCCICFIIFLIVLVLFVYKKNESFTQCMRYPSYIVSLDIDIVLNKNTYIYELSLSNFRELIKNDNVVAKDPQTLINKLNRLEYIKNSEIFFEKIYQIDNEVLIYRQGKYYGFHILLSKANEPVTVKGIVNDYDILSKFTEHKHEDLEDIELRMRSDPVLSSYYSGMSSS